jgi:hypothetical protein
MVSKKQRVIFLMPPKTASNSLTDCLRKSEIQFEPLRSKTFPTIHLYLSELASMYNIHNIDEYKIVQIVRDPAHRFASSYFHQMRTLSKVETNLTGMEFEEFAEHFKDCIGEEGDYLKRFFGRTDFMLKSIRSGKSWGTSRLLLAQHQWNDMGADVKIFKLEKIGKDITPLANYLGVDLPQMPNKNSNKKEVNYDELLNENILSIVKEIYEKDYKYFKY